MGQRRKMLYDDHLRLGQLCMGHYLPMHQRCDVISFLKQLPLVLKLHEIASDFFKKAAVE